MKQSLFVTVVRSLLLAAFVGLFGLYVFQMDTLERRLIDDQKQIAELRDASEKHAGLLDKRLAETEAAARMRAQAIDRQLAEGREVNDRIAVALDRLTKAIESGRVAVPAGGVERGSGPSGDNVGAPRTAGSNPQATSSSDRKWLHPDVPNLLEPEPFQMTVPEATTDGKLVRWFGTDPKGFNMIIENAADLQEYVWMYCGEYFSDRHRWTDPGKWRPLAAERVEVTNGGKDVTVYIKKGIKWHKPLVDWSNKRYDWLKGDHPVTARDVKFTWDLVRNPQVQAGHLKNYYEDLGDVEVHDDYTFTFHWTKPFFGAIEQTITWYTMPEFIFAFDEDGHRYAPETLGLKFNEHWYNDRFIGWGPYYFAQYEPGVKIVLKRNEEYHGPKPDLKELTWLIYADPAQNLLKIKSKELDFSGLTPGQYRDELQRYEAMPKEQRPMDSPFLDGSILNKKYTGMVYYYLGWNMDRPLFQDKRVRRALSCAFNRRGIIDNVFVGLGDVQAGPFFSLSPYNDPAIKPLPFDLKEAARLLAEAGWKDTDGNGVLDRVRDDKKEEFEFSFLIYASSPEYASMANIFKEDLYKIGVKLNIQAVEWAAMQKKMDDKEFDCFTGGWGEVWDPDPYQIWHSSQADVPKGSNRVGFRNKEADAIIEELRRTFDHEKRVALCRRFHRILHEEQPYTWFWARQYVAVWWSHVKHVEFSIDRPHAYSLPWYSVR